MKRCAGWAWLRNGTAWSPTASNVVWLSVPNKGTTEAAQVIAQLPLQSQPQSQSRALAVSSDLLAALTC